MFRWVLDSVHPERTPAKGAFSIQKDASFFKIKEIKGLRGGVLLYAAQEKPRIDAEIGKNSPFWTETRYNVIYLSIDTKLPCVLAKKSCFVRDNGANKPEPYWT